jgi:hypothetical protein
MGGFDVDRELARVFGDGVRPLRFEEALFEAVLEGWVRQQRARLLSEATIGPRATLVRRLHMHAGAWPWEWRAEDLEEWVEDLAGWSGGSTHLDPAQLPDRDEVVLRVPA